MADDNVKLAIHFQNLAGQCPMTNYCRTDTQDVEFDSGCPRNTFVVVSNKFTFDTQVKTSPTHNFTYLSQMMSLKMKEAPNTMS